MPNRIIKESIHSSARLNALTDFQFRLWVGLLTYVDDFGRGDARTAIIRGSLFPLRQRVSERLIREGLRALEDAGCIRLYQVEGLPYLCFPSWEKHQRIQTKKPKYPGPEEAGDGEDGPSGASAPAGEGDNPSVTALAGDAPRHLPLQGRTGGRMVSAPAGDGEIPNSEPHSPDSEPHSPDSEPQIPNSELRIPNSTVDHRESPWATVDHRDPPPESNPNPNPNPNPNRESTRSGVQGGRRSPAPQPEADQRPRQRAQRARAVFLPPSPEEIRDYCVRRHSSVDPAEFYEFFQAGGWKDSRGEPVRNWKQKLITWEGLRRERQKLPAAGGLAGELQDSYAMMRDWANE